MNKWLQGFLLLICATVFAGCSLPNLNPKAGLQVETFSDVPADLYLNGKFISSTPYINKLLKPGDYSLEIRPKDSTLAVYQTKITLSDGLLTVVHWKLGNRPETSGGIIYEMEKLTDPKSAELSITTIPDGTIVQVDGVAQGFTPVLLEHLPVGEHQYQVSLPSYETQKNPITLFAGFRMNITLKLAKQLEPVASNSAVVNPDVASPASPAAQVATVSATTPATSKPASASGVSVLGTSTSATGSALAKLERPKIRITSTGYFLNGQEVLHVRTAANPNSSSPGVAPVGSEYSYLNQLTNGWYKISFNGQPVWVSAQFAQVIQ